MLAEYKHEEEDKLSARNFPYVKVPLEISHHTHQSFHRALTTVHVHLAWFNEAGKFFGSIPLLFCSRKWQYRTANPNIENDEQDVT
jgi:hypothetical protein